MSTDSPFEDPEQPDQFEDFQKEKATKPAARKTPPDATEEKESTKETAPETKEPARVEEAAAEEAPSPDVLEEPKKSPQVARRQQDKVQPEPEATRRLDKAMTVLDQPKVHRTVIVILFTVVLILICIGIFAWPDTSQPPTGQPGPAAQQPADTPDTPKEKPVDRKESVASTGKYEAFQFSDDWGLGKQPEGETEVQEK